MGIPIVGLSLDVNSWYPQPTMVLPARNTGTVEGADAGDWLVIHSDHNHRIASGSCQVNKSQ